MSDVKLPKQWKHWCRQAGLRVQGQKYTKADHIWYYLKGHGRGWRLNCHGMFQCGDTYEEFDRWALCDIEELPMPTSLREMLVAVNALLIVKG